MRDHHLGLMKDHSSKDWRQSAAWPTDHEVRRAFTRLAKRTLETKRRGFGNLAQIPSAGELKVLEAGLQRLGAAGAAPSPSGTDEFGWIVDDPDAPGVDHDRSTWLEMMGLPSGTPWPLQGAYAARAYVVAQYRAIQARGWATPGQAIVYAAAQMASHNTLSTVQGQDEPEVTIKLITEFSNTIRDVLIPAMEGEGAHLPEGQFLDVATASTSNHSDRLGADFAVVTGLVIDGVVKYRVALFQAKWEDENQRGKADVWHKGGGQLAELLSTGIGYYLFYPRRYREGEKARPVFLPTVRSARDVERDALALTTTTVRMVDTCNGTADVAWDFGGFLGLALASLENNGVGGIYDTQKEVVELLSRKRKRPLARAAIFYDHTPGRSLNLFELAEAIKGEGFDVDTFSVPVAGDQRVIRD
ncbi:hypothetical protein FPV16_21020 [Methylobacterium sp. W2]|nr:hypothetical protein [Methylobacterium sp. W2]